MQKPQRSHTPDTLPGHSDSSVPSTMMNSDTQQAFSKFRSFMRLSPDTEFIIG